MSSFVDGYLCDITSAAIAGHVNPDGDCIGSCCALYHYIKKNYPAVSVTLYLEEPKPTFYFLNSVREARQTYEGQRVDRLFILDTSTAERIGVSNELINSASHTVCIDHHISNPGFADVNVIEPDASSASELLYTLLDPGKVDLEAAEAIYTGIVHDTGIFHYPSTSARTLEIAAKLMAAGIRFGDILDETFYSRTLTEIKATGAVLSGASLHFGGACVLGTLTYEEMKKCSVTKQELDSIIAQLRMVAGTEAAVFIYPVGENECKASFRSRKKLDVSRLAASFGGGGHVRAAGCSFDLPVQDAVEPVLEAVGKALAEAGIAGTETSVD